MAALPTNRPTRGIRPRRPPKASTTPRPDSPAARAAEPPVSGERMIVLAAVAGAHGLGGEVKLKLFTADLAAHRTLAAGARTLTLEALRGDIARFAEVTDRTAAEGLRGATLAIPRSALPPLADGEYYHADLIGLPCADTAGDVLGEVVTVENFGAGDVLEIERPDGRRFMVPMIPAAVPEWNAERMIIDAAFVT